MSYEQNFRHAALTGRPPPTQVERDLFALPVRMGGLALINCTTHAAFEFNASVKITEPLTNAILAGNTSYSYDVIAGQLGPRQKSPL